MRTRVAVLLVAACVAAYAASAACCKRPKVRRSAAVRSHTICKTTENKTAENGGKIGVVSLTEGPNSFLGMTFGKRWPMALDEKAARKEQPFEPETPFRSFDKYAVKLKSGRVGEVILEKKMGSKEAAEAEIAVCVDLMTKKFNCVFEGTPARQKAQCCAVRRSTCQQTKGRIVEVPVMELEIACRGATTVRIVARSLRASLFTSEVKAPTARDYDAL